VQKRQPEEIEEFAPVGGDDREPDEEEILRQLAAQWWNGTEQQMAKAQNTLAAMGWEIGQDESGDDDAGVFVIRAGDENGNSYVAFPHSELDLSETAQDGVSNPGDPGNDSIEPMQGHDPKTAGGISNPGDPGNDSIEPMQGYDPKYQPNDRIVDPMEEDELKAIRRLAFGKEELDELDFSGSTPTQAQTDTFNAVNAAAGPAVKLGMQAGEKFQSGNNVGGAVDAAKAVYNVADAAGLSKTDLALQGLKAGGNAALAYMRGKDPAAAAAGSVASDITQPLADYTNSKDFGSDFYTGMSNGGNPANPLQKAYDNNLVNQDSVRTAANSMNKTANQLKSGDASAMQNFKPPSLYRDDQTPYLDINKRNVITQQPVQTKAEIQAANPISGVTPAATTPTPAPKATTPAPKATTPAPAAPTTPAATFEMADGKSLGCYGDDDQGYELRNGEQALPSRFRSLDDAGMAVKLYRARRQAQRRNSNTDYIEER
jgi:hypothetical protein